MLFVASTVHAMAGAGTAMVAMPPLVLALGVQQATPLVGLAALFTVLVVLARDWRAIDLRASGRLLAGSVLGIPCGVLMIQALPGALLEAALGLLLAAYGAFQLWRPRLPQGLPRGAVYPFGFVAGVLGGAYNTNGPPVILYGLMARWSPQRFRATLSGYFLPTAVVVCATHALGGLWTAQTFVALAWSLPVLIVGNLCGRRLASTIDPVRFTRLLHALVLGAGLLLMF
ncbi:MAG: sulfite exporter TauE/SafE family protein [Gammaproteobacteria bacterium]|nr:sulfite exporter TauE/SafE family protein [Gammaproteobacteria bacterium]